MNKPFYVTITQSTPPYASEVVLRLQAESEEDARQKAEEWVLKDHAFFVGKGYVSDYDIEDDVKIIDIPSDDGK